MAHSAAINGLTEALVLSVTSFDREDRTFKQSRDAAVKGLRSPNHARTNQFDVQAEVSGLVEKFSVLNRENLADALQTRLNELPSDSKWLPEILSLLLQLSDRPLESQTLENLEGLAGDVSPSPELTWAEIVADDPLDEADIWDDVDCGYNSSSDDAALADEGDAERIGDTQATSVNEEDLVTLAYQGVIEPDESALDDIKAAREQLDALDVKRDYGHHLAELIAIRETLSMLHGLPTDLFHLDPANGDVVTKRSCHLSTSTKAPVQNLLRQFADIGRNLDTLRKWAQSKYNLSYLQTIQASAQRLLTGFSTDLAHIEQRYLQAHQRPVVSLVAVHVEVRELSRPCIALSGIVEDCTASIARETLPYAFLDALYEQSCVSQMAGDDVVFNSISLIFLDGVRTYLSTLKCWVAEGILPNPDVDHFLVQHTNEPCELSCAWDGRFSLARLNNGSPCAPSLIQPFVSRILDIGKTKAFIRLLDPTEESEAENESFSSGLPEVAQSSMEMNTNPLLPFSEFFNLMLEDWLFSMGIDSSLMLRTKLLERHGLNNLLEALQYVYFSKDGVHFQAFAESLLDYLGKHSRPQQDSFLLTELIQSTIGAETVVDAGNLVIQIKGKYSSKMETSSVFCRLEAIQVDYLFSWPIQNITHCASSQTHSKALALLLQTYSAKNALRSGFMDLRALTGVTASLSLLATKTLRLRHQLLCFVDTLQAHITNTAAALHTEMHGGMERANGIDEMAAIWAGYIDRLRTALLLRDSLELIRRSIIGVLQLCEHFARLWNHQMSASNRTDSSPAERNTSLLKECGRLLAEYETATSFIIAGLRGVSRAGGETALEALAERLEWKGG